MHKICLTKKTLKSMLDGPIGALIMTSNDFWAKLKEHGFTKYKEYSVGSRRSVMLQSRERQLVTVSHPDDFNFDQRREILDKFLSLNVL